MQHVDDGLAFATGVRWQRAVKRVFEANVRRQIDITYNVAGAPMRLKPAENNIDVTRLLVGIVPDTPTPVEQSQAFSLAGLARGSYLEGAIWEEMQSVQGISAAKALLLEATAVSRSYRRRRSNVDAKLGRVISLPRSKPRSAAPSPRAASPKSPAPTSRVGRWTGTGYILQDPRTGAATYPISGGWPGEARRAKVPSGAFGRLFWEPSRGLQGARSHRC